MMSYPLVSATVFVSGQLVVHPSIFVAWHVVSLSVDRLCQDSPPPKKKKNVFAFGFDLFSSYIGAVLVVTPVVQENTTAASCAFWQV